jgi:chaperone BCS1
MFDGLFTPGNGCILFMTGNNPERLDNALIRPGRVDKIIKFDYPKKKEVQKAFNAIVGEGFTDDVNDTNFSNFYKNISGSQISMAGIVDYLFRHPHDYLDCISELNTHTQILHEITDKSSKLYT